MRHVWRPLVRSTRRSTARGASVACLSVCKTPFLLAPEEGWGPGLRPPVGFQCPNLELKTLNLRNFDCNFALFGGKIWLWLFYNLFCVMVLRFYTKNFKSFGPKMKAWRWFLRFKIKSKFGKNTVTPSVCPPFLRPSVPNFPEFWFHFELGKSMLHLHFCSKWLEIFCVQS